VNSYPPGQPMPPVNPSAKKNYTLPIVCGIGGCLGLGCMGVFALLFLVIWAAPSTQSGGSGGQGRGAGGENRQQTQDYAQETVTYVNKRENFSGKLAEVFVPFSFQYPAHWKRDPKAGTGSSPNYVKVENAVNNDGSELTLENFAVGYWHNSSGEDSDSLFPVSMAQLEPQFQQKFPNYQKVYEGSSSLSGFEGYELQFEGFVQRPGGDELKIYGRALLVSSKGTGLQNGVTLIMLGTSASPDIRSPQDLGVKGEMPIILNTFKLGE
jgi:hypothetical protein